MAENKNDSKTRSMWIVGGVILLVLIAGVVFVRVRYYDNSNNGSNDHNDQEISDELKQELDTINQYANEIRPLLTDKGKAALDKVTEYINADPNVLLYSYSDHPQSIRESVAIVNADLGYNYGTTIPGYGENDENGNARKGEIRGVYGKLEKADEDDPFGSTYKVKVSDTDDSYYYFIFGEETTKNIEDNDMVGKDVLVEIEMTGEGQGFKVVKGPVLVEAEETN